MAGAGGPNERVARLIDLGQEAFLREEHAAARAQLEEAVTLARQLHEAAPDERRSAYQLGSALYALAAVRTATAAPQAAVPALDEALRAYRKLPVAAARPLVADVRLRRARAHALTGAGASAVADAQAAIVAYVRLSTPEVVDDAYLGLARTLLMASDVLAAYADPELALAAAREGLNWAVGAVNEGKLRRDRTLTDALVLAAAVEVALLRRLGRAAETANAEGLLASFGTPKVPLLMENHGIGGLSVSDGGVAGAVRIAAATLPRAGELLGKYLLDDPVGPLVAPIFRMPPERLGPGAMVVAGAARGLLTRGRSAAGVRLGMEAHWLYAFILDEVLDQRVEFDERLEQAFAAWVQLLGELAGRAEATGDAALARDLADWGTRAFLVLDPDIETAERIAVLGPATAVFDRLQRG
jgi:hypothetical protein